MAGKVKSKGSILTDQKQKSFSENNEEFAHLMQNGDRVMVILGRTIQIAAYEPANITLGYSSSIREDETPDEAMNRVFSFVGRQLAPKVAELHEIKKNK